MKARIWRDETLGAEYDDVDIPEDLLEQAKTYREQMIEAIAESDDVLFEKFIEGTPISEAEITAGIRKATIAQKIFPVISTILISPRLIPQTFMARKTSRSSSE